MTAWKTTMNSQWKIVYTKDALKDKRIACESGFKKTIESLLEIMRNDPYAPYPPYEKLIGDLLGLYSRRINKQHRIVYQVYNPERTVKIISMWQHYE